MMVNDKQQHLKTAVVWWFPINGNYPMQNWYIEKTTSTSKKEVKNGQHLGCNHDNGDNLDRRPNRQIVLGSLDRYQAKWLNYLKGQHPIITTSLCHSHTMNNNPVFHQHLLNILLLIVVKIQKNKMRKHKALGSKVSEIQAQNQSDASLHSGTGMLEITVT